MIFFLRTHKLHFSSNIRFETVDLTTRLLIPIIVLQNHNRYNILQAGHNYSIDVQAIEQEVCHIFFLGDGYDLFFNVYGHENLSPCLQLPHFFLAVYIF